MNDDLVTPYIPEERLKDAAGRRRKHAPRQPLPGITRYVTPQQYELLAWNHYCGGFVSTDLFHEYIKLTGLYSGYDTLSRSLLALRQELGMLECPDFESGAKRVDPSIHPPLAHRNSELCDDRLKAKKLFSKYAPRPGGSKAHQMMASNLYASYWIHAKKLGIPFTHQHEILERVGHGIEFYLESMEEAVNRVRREYPDYTNEQIAEKAPTVRKKLVPDSIFMLHFKKNPIIIFLEADRATEPGKSTDDKRKSWGKNIEEYKVLIGDGGTTEKAYKKRYGLPMDCGAQVHAITLPDDNYRPVMQKKILTNIERIFSADGRTPKCSYISLHTSYAFVPSCVPPKWIPIHDTVWERVGFDPYTLPTI